MEMQYFAVRLIAPRPSFVTDMTTVERDIMQRHQVYWTEQMNNGKVIVFGPVFDPKGPYGLGVIRVKDQAEADQFLSADPAAAILGAECSPMIAVVPQH